MVEFYCLFKQIQILGLILTETDRFKIAYNNCFSLSFQLQFAQSTAWTQEDNRLCHYAITVACCVMHLTKDRKKQKCEKYFRNGRFPIAEKADCWLTFWLVS